MGAIVHLLDLIRIDADEAEEAGSVVEANELWKGGAYVCILTAASLRGHEGFFLELAGLWALEAFGQGKSWSCPHCFKQEYSSHRGGV
jgi:hypothetical protein